MAMGATDARPTIEDLVQQSEALVPLLRQRAARAEELRRIRTKQSTTCWESANIECACAAN